ncbi:MAG TPA: cytochrome d ubiquinol oxidase subunit II, partial [Castellaniella sp.]|nr:cytochrome d ubiquinol oxidase subunit II [Castellaniella sp.]
WDGNETWLVLGGAGLFAAFPLAYSVVLTALYLPLIFMLIALIFRGVAFEFRFKATDHSRHWWDKAFIGGSIATAFFQGVTLGAYLDGIAVVDRSYAGGAMDWLSPFSLFTGVGLVIAYALLGSTWLIMKTDGTLQQRMFRLTRHTIWALLAVIVILSVWTPLLDERIAERWFSMPNILWFAPVPILVVLVALGLLRSLASQRDGAPFVLTLCLVFLGYSGLGISIWPYIIPPDITLQQAAGPPQSLGFTLVGALLIIPIILIYTASGYYIFRHKVRHGEGYH